MAERKPAKKRHAEVRQNHHRERQEVQGIHGRGTGCDEGARPRAEGGITPRGRGKRRARALTELTATDEARIARTHAITRDVVSPGTRAVPAPPMRQKTSRVSFLMCPFCVRSVLFAQTTTFERLPANAHRREAASS